MNYNENINWRMISDEALKTDQEELKWSLMRYEVRTKAKFKPI